MIRILPALAAALAACTSSPQEPTMHRSGNAGAAPDGAAQDRAAVGPAAAPVSAAENPISEMSTESAVAAQGRRTLSTAFVRVGPDGWLTVTLRDGRALALRGVEMRRKDYCGALADGGQFCGGYAEVAAARPGGGPSRDAPDLAGPKARKPPG